ncbi:MAG TPA: hypothetical protein DEG92_07465 [Rikenellaceae bacterium]|nr:hypothetical protein [Rikenellaceae bacterium]
MDKNIGLIRYRWVIIIATVLLTAASLIPLLTIKVNPDLESYLPDKMQSKMNNDRIGEVFGTSEPVILIFETDDILNSSTLERIDKLTNEFGKMSEFASVISLYTTKDIRSENGSMIVNPVVKAIPQTLEKKEILRGEIKKNDIAYKLLVSEDFKYTLLLLNSNKSIKDKQLIELIYKKLDEFPGNEKVYLNGQPYLRSEANDKISRDIMILLPIGLLIMLLFFWVSFRELKGVLLPFSVVLISIIVSMALIPLFGWELSIIGILIPIMMLAIANNYGVHFIARYQELNALDPDISMKEIVTEAIAYLKKPVLLCGLTTIVGILGLIVHILLPASQMGVVSSIGIAIALVLSLTFIPAVLSVMKKGKVHFDIEGENKSKIAHVLDVAGNYATKYPGRIILFFFVFIVITLAGLFNFKAASDFNNILPQKHSYNQSINITNNAFGGSKIINIMFEGDIKDPVILNKMLKYEEELEKIAGVGSVTSIATLIRKMSTALNDSSDLGYNSIPETRDGVAQYIELYSMNGDPSDFENFVDFDYTKAIMSIQCNYEKLSEAELILSKIKELTKDDPGTVIGGYSLVEKEMSEAVVTGQYYSLIFAFFAIMILLALIFRSAAAGLIGSIPLLYSVFCTFGLMGWLGIELNIITALLSSISIGLGVDFTIHIFWRVRSELSLGVSYAAAFQTAIRTTGRGITINAVSVMLGFSVLSLSAFPLIKSFALLIILSLMFCLFSALMLIPAICIIFKPRFLNKKQ